MQQQQVSYGAGPGMAQQAPPYPSPANPSYGTPNPNQPYGSSLNYPQYHHLSYAQASPHYPPPPEPPILPSVSSDYATYPAYSPQEIPNTLYTQDPPPPVYAPPPLSEYSDPSYSPRVPAYERSSFEPSAATTTNSSYVAAGSQSWSSGYDYQMNRSSSFGGYNAVDPYNPSGYSQSAPRWGCEQSVEEFGPTSDTRYGSLPVENSRTDFGVGNLHEKPFVESSRPDYSGVYAYDGGNSQPYGSRGTGASRWSSENSNPLGDLPKLAKALPKVESESKGGGVQKYHVKLLQDSSSVGLPTNVVCQIGLDGVRLVDPSSSRNLRIYPLDTITKWEVNEPSVFTFWAKNAVDFEQRRTRLQSSSATTNAILDTLTAACVQLCEMVGKDADAAKSSITSSAAEAQKKASFADWLIRPKQPVQEEKEHWVPDEAVTKCTACASDFGPFLRRHHCRNCGDIFCDKCTRGRTALSSDEDAQPVRVCDRCLAEVTHRLTNAKDTSGTTKFGLQQTHEDLAKKLQEEMERNAPRKTVVASDSRSSTKSGGQTSLLTCSKCGSISIVTGNTTRCPSCGTDSSGGRKNGVTKKTSRTESSRRRTREVACPTCTVHLEVEVPSFGSETVECGVCQHPFLVNA